MSKMLGRSAALPPLPAPHAALLPRRDANTLDAEIEARGQFAQTDEGFKLGAIGRVKWQRFRFLGTPFLGLKTEFSWQDGDIYLRKLLVNHEDGDLSGQILLQGDVIPYSTSSSLPLSAFRAFIKDDSAEALPLV